MSELETKIGDKRVTDDFEQFEECQTCKNGFWARSVYELGDWQRKCPSCVQEYENSPEYKAETQEKDRRTEEIESLEKKTKEVLIDGRVLTSATIDDYIREVKNKGLVIYWPQEGLDILRIFLFYHNYYLPPDFAKDGFKFMGVTHYLRQ